MANTDKQIHEVTRLTGQLADSDLFMIERATGQDGQYKTYSATAQQIIQRSQTPFDLDKIWPVGSVYIGLQDTIPFTGTWEKIGQGLCLMGATTAHPAGTTVEAGLPAVTGAVTGLTCAEAGAHSHTYKHYYINTTGSAGATSGFAPSSETTSAAGAHTHNITGTINISGTGLYGKSTTVQPPALAVNIWRRKA